MRNKQNEGIFDEIEKKVFSKKTSFTVKHRDGTKELEVDTIVNNNLATIEEKCKTVLEEFQRLQAKPMRE